MYYRYKKGVSPLVATVLLIAFVVAIGAVFITYTGNLAQCTTIQVSVAKAHDVPDVCLDVQQKAIKMTVQNGPDAEVYGFKATVVGRNEVINMDLVEPLGKAETKRLLMPYNMVISGELEKVRLLPLQNEKTVCPVEKVIEVEGIVECVG